MVSDPICENLCVPTTTQMGRQTSLQDTQKTHWLCAMGEIGLLRPGLKGTGDQPNLDGLRVAPTVGSAALAGPPRGCAFIIIIG